MSEKKKVYSGIRATGRLHLGNYFGAVKGMLELQDKYDCVFSVVDLHAITTPYDPKTLKNNVLNSLGVLSNNSCRSIGIMFYWVNTNIVILF